MGAWIARASGLPHLYDMHSSLPQQFANFGRFNWGLVVATFRALERFAISSADGVIAICPELREHVVASGYDRPLALIENTLDFDIPAIGDDQVMDLKRRLGLSTARVALYTGTLEAYQGLDLLLEAAPAVLSHEPSARFVLVGGQPPQIEQLRARARGLGVESHFVFVPVVPPTDVFAYHRLADVLVTTRARGTNTPLKIYQYLRAGRPIVATGIRSHTQVLDETSAELVAPTPGDIARGLVRVLGDGERARTLADGARRLAQERYSEQAYLDSLSGLLAELSNSDRRRRGVN